jgi:hypothetical protein
MLGLRKPKQAHILGSWDRVVELDFIRTPDEYPN